MELQLLIAQNPLATALAIGFVIICLIWTKRPGKKDTARRTRVPGGKNIRQTDSSVAASAFPTKHGKNKKKWDDVFDGCSFVVSGNFSVPVKQLKGMIVENGGIVKTAVSGQVEYVVVSDRNHKNATAAKKHDIPVVSEKFIHDCIAKGELLAAY